MSIRDGENKMLARYIAAFNPHEGRLLYKVIVREQTI